MDMIMYLFIALICFNVAAKIFNSEERNKVFNKRPIEVVDVKKYNKYCGTLVIVFCFAAEFTLFVGKIFGGWVNVVSPLFLIGEAVGVMFIYNRLEIKMLKKR